MEDYGETDRYHIIDDENMEDIIKDLNEDSTAMLIEYDDEFIVFIDVDDDVNNTVIFEFQN